MDKKTIKGLMNPVRMKKYIEIQSDVLLEGIIETPEQETKSIFIMISGSGPADIDGNYKSMKMNIYKLLSQEINKLGYATLRYNKRGIGKSKGEFLTSGLTDFIKDLDSCVKYVKENTKFSKIYLLGHSEGSIIATLYSKNNPLDGMILLAGAGITLKTAMMQQNNSILQEIDILKGFKGKLLRTLVREKSLYKKQNKLFEKIEKSTKDIIRIQLVKLPAKWMREHFAYSDEDILRILNESKIPILGITGTKDVQADSNDLDNILKLNKENIDVVKIPDMDHMLREFTEEKSVLNLKKQYKGEMNKPLSSSLTSEIDKWLNRIV